MAKRKRLDLPTGPLSPDLETKSALSAPRARMPIAEVAGDTADRAALEEVAREMTRAEAEGRVVKALPLKDIITYHISRDRLALDEEEMEALMASIAERGQQTPIEVVPIHHGYGLISGLRRMEALRRLGQDTVLAFVRQQTSGREKFQAMIDENEIRADLSFYERVNIAAIAVEQKMFADVKAAVHGLFAHATPAKRSKIIKFEVIRQQLGKALTFPAAVPEKFGFALAQALEADAGLAGRIIKALKATKPADATAERQVLERALKGDPAPGPVSEALTEGLKWQAKPGRLVLSGEALTPEFLEALRAFAVSHAKKA
ncbi:MAG: ParB N-terminal domain-containing protein [Pseudomonadota bacterium]